jgi:ubiquinone/menaquinone biosynthesis C-methylase UbiE
VSFEQLLSLLQRGGLEGEVVLDIGTGSGRLALALAPHAGRVIGIDRDASAIDEANRRAALAGLANVEFLVSDAETIEYAEFSPDVVAAHLCVSDPIIERAGRALKPGGSLGFVAFHEDHWMETGRRSRFAYDRTQAERVLDASGFTVEYLEVDRRVETFGSVEEALAAAVSLQEKWKADGRWFRYLDFLETGGRTLTRSHLVCFARRR